MNFVVHIMEYICSWGTKKAALKNKDRLTNKPYKMKLK